MIWIMYTQYMCGQELLGRCSDWLRAGRAGIESRWGSEFPHPSKWTLGPAQPPIQSVPVLPRCKAADTLLWPHNTYCYCFVRVGRNEGKHLANWFCRKQAVCRLCFGCSGAGWRRRRKTGTLCGRRTSTEGAG